jgi:hypothetical protein
LASAPELDGASNSRRQLTPFLILALEVWHWKKSAIALSRTADRDQLKHSIVSLVILRCRSLNSLRLSLKVKGNAQRQNEGGDTKQG